MGQHSINVDLLWVKTFDVLQIDPFSCQVFLVLRSEKKCEVKWFLHQFHVKFLTKLPSTNLWKSLVSACCLSLSAFSWALSSVRGFKTDFLLRLLLGMRYLLGPPSGESPAACRFNNSSSEEVDPHMSSNILPAPGLRSGCFAHKGSENISKNDWKLKSKSCCTIKLGL